MSSSAPALSGIPRRLVNQAISLARLLDTLRLWAELTGAPDTGYDRGKQAAPAVRPTRVIVSDLRRCAQAAESADSMEALLAVMLEAGERAEALARAVDKVSRHRGSGGLWQRLTAKRTKEPGTSLPRLLQELPSRKAAWQAELEMKHNRPAFGSGHTAGVELVGDVPMSHDAGTDPVAAADEDDSPIWNRAPEMASQDELPTASQVEAIAVDEGLASASAMEAAPIATPLAQPIVRAGELGVRDRRRWAQ